MDNLNLLISGIFIPVIGAIIYVGKKLADTWLKQTTEISTAFVDHVAKQTVITEAIRINLEQLNKAVIETQEKNTAAMLSALKQVSNSLKHLQEESNETVARQNQLLKNICTYIESNDKDIVEANNGIH